jgi:hypothetical protein
MSEICGTMCAFSISSFLPLFAFSRSLHAAANNAMTSSRKPEPCRESSAMTFTSIFQSAVTTLGLGVLGYFLLLE